MAFQHWYCEKCSNESTVQYPKDASVYHVRNQIGRQHGKKSMDCANKHGLDFIRLGFRGESPT